jgi:hypothetical protein
VNDNDTTFDAAQGAEHRAHQLSHVLPFLPPAGRIRLAGLEGGYHDY